MVVRVLCAAACMVYVNRGGGGWWVVASNSATDGRVGRHVDRSVLSAKILLKLIRTVSVAVLSGVYISRGRSGGLVVIILL